MAGFEVITYGRIEVITEACESIARDLQARGVPRARPSKTGNRPAGVWILERVHQIVRAPTYRGTWVADRARGLSVKVPQIVSEALYHQADAALRRAGRRGQLRNPHKYLLQGMATCGLCGASIGCASTGNWSTAHGNRRHFYYVCSRRRRSRRGAAETCTLPMVRSDALDAGSGTQSSMESFGTIIWRRPSASAPASQNRSLTGPLIWFGSRWGSSGLFAPKRFFWKGSGVVS